MISNLYFFIKVKAYCRMIINIEVPTKAPSNDFNKQMNKIIWSILIMIIWTNNVVINIEIYNVSPSIQNDFCLIFLLRLLFSVFIRNFCLSFFIDFFVFFGFFVWMVIVSLFFLKSTISLCLFLWYYWWFL